jgi:transaldolase
MAEPIQTIPRPTESSTHALRGFGQALWLDDLGRELLDSGELRRLIDEDGLAGVTSNPTIFERAISGGTEYRDDIARLRTRCAKEPARVYEELAIADVRRACDAFAPLYASSGGRDGFVSLEVSPKLAHDTDATIDEARRLHREVARENVMVKVPGTPEGMPAIAALIAAGIDVNVTLLFSVTSYVKVLQAHAEGLEERIKTGGDPARVHSVASFFVSRVDTECDARLDAFARSASTQAERDAARKLRGKIGIANAKLAYRTWQRWVSGARWRALEERGADAQRLVWASTGTKDPTYSDVLYVEELIGRDTIATLPPKTLAAFRDHGRVRESLVEEAEGWIEHVTELEELGISLEEVCRHLLDDGVRKFDESFDSLLTAIARKGR